jgi:lysophospholipase L1-like esterase
MNNKNRGLRGVVFRVAALVVSVGVALVGAELAIRISGVLPDIGAYYVWPPHARRILHPNPEIMPGIAGEARFYINNMGMRGDEYVPAANQFRILTVGGSTTETTYLDQDETWAALIQQKLKKTVDGRDVWVGNVGKSGYSSVKYLLILQYLLPQLSDTDAVIVLAGVNDLSGAWKQRDLALYDPEVDHGSKVRQTFWSDSSLYCKTYTTFLAYSVMNRLTNAGLGIDETGSWVQDPRNQRRNASRFIDDMPAQFDRALERYEENIVSMGETVRKNSARIVFLTQPYAWRNDLPAEFNDLLWFGGNGRGEYYSLEAMIQSLDAFNRRLLDTCRDHEFECVDLAPELNGNLDCFYDDVHFNEAGAAKVADVVAAYMKARPPFLE